MRIQNKSLFLDTPLPLDTHDVHFASIICFTWKVKASIDYFGFLRGVRMSSRCGKNNNLSIPSTPCFRFLATLLNIFPINMPQKNFTRKIHVSDSIMPNNTAKEGVLVSADSDLRRSFSAFLLIFDFFPHF